LLLAVICLLPVLLAPLFSRWLDDAPPVGAGGAGLVILKYASLAVLLLAASGLVIRMLARVEPFTPVELVVVMTMMLSACAVIWSGFHRLWAHQLVAPFFHLETYPRWAPFVKALPGWLVPSTDPENKEVIYNFYAGQSDVPWAAWA